MIALIASKSKVHYPNSRRNGERGCQPIGFYLRRNLREAAKFVLLL